MRTVLAGALIAALVALPRAASADSITVGARIGPQSIFLEGDGSPSDLRGYVAGLDVTVPLSRYLGLAGVLEGSIYDRRSDRLEPGAAATSWAPFAELRVDTNPDGPWSCRIDLGTGYRWLLLPLVSGSTDSYGGVEPLRLRVGPAYRSGRVEVALVLGAGFGWFVARPGARSCAVTGTCQDSLLDSDTASPVHFVGDLSAAVRVWP
jgi:hypothetical protein